MLPQNLPAGAHGESLIASQDNSVLKFLPD